MIDSLQDFSLLCGDGETGAGLPRILVCVNLRPDRPSCAGAGSRELADVLEAAALAGGLVSPVERLVCLGECRSAPVVRISGGRFWLKAAAKDVPEIVAALAAARGT